MESLDSDLDSLFESWDSYPKFWFDSSLNGDSRSRAHSVIRATGPPTSSTGSPGTWFQNKKNLFLRKWQEKVESFPIHSHNIHGTCRGVKETHVDWPFKLRISDSSWKLSEMSIFSLKKLIFLLWFLDIKAINLQHYAIWTRLYKFVKLFYTIIMIMFFTNRIIQGVPRNMKVARRLEGSYNLLILFFNLILEVKFLG